MYNCAPDHPVHFVQNEPELSETILEINGLRQFRPISLAVISGATWLDGPIRKQAKFAGSGRLAHAFFVREGATTCNYGRLLANFILHRKLPQFSASCLGRLGSRLDWPESKPPGLPLYSFFLCKLSKNTGWRLGTRLAFSFNASTVRWECGHKNSNFSRLFARCAAIWNNVSSIQTGAAIIQFVTEVYAGTASRIARVVAGGGVWPSCRS
jgi:hypothetical protein